MAEQEKAVKKNPVARAIDAVCDLLSSFFLPFINLLVAAGIMKGLIALLVFTGAITEGSPTYTVIYAMGDALFYFIPIFLAYTSAKRFGVNKFTALLAACILLYPNLSTLMDAGEDFALFGLLPITAVTYSSSVIPILLTIYLLKWVEILCQRVIPQMVRDILTPPVCLIIVIPVALMVFGPLGTVIGTWLASGYEALFGLSPIVAGLVIGAFFQVMVIFGFNWGIFPIMLNNIAVLGYDTILPMMGGSTFAMGGAALAVGLRTKNKAFRTTAISAMVATLFGITEPAVYGVHLRLKKPMVCGCIGGAVGGAIAGAFGVQASAFAFPALTTLPVFWNVSFGAFLVSLAVSFVVGFVLTLVVGFEDLPEGAEANSSEPVAEDVTESATATA
ncbi:PTS transporter subunit EIIC [uncultured Enorma sp.]|jgi:PTS system beta-glucosides-specific IIC component|uniref:PTS transporter subunit EIIC n=1 Tax=uncultured Enorma sp. TaxID=1714346 RepID=UPI0025D1A651|nr:PTS transporter subunit EIIC [uncultured Enorma sp.]